MRIYKILLILIIIISFLLRFYKLDVNPPGLYIDEISIANNAFDILTTGKDEYGKSFPMFFRSFGDYKMPGYIYLTSGAMLIFGKDEFSVRFSSAFFGSLTILLIFLFTKKILDLESGFGIKKKEKIALLSAFLLSIMPWHIQFSRGGFEANVALFFFMSGFLLFIYFLENRKYLLMFSSLLFFALSIYTYHSYRIITPFSVIFLSVLYLIKFPKDKKSFLFSIGTFMVLTLPIILFSFSPEGSQRFSATSVFNEVKNADSILQKLIFYPLAILKNYLSFYSFGFLFDTGDGIGRHQIHNFGPLFKWQLPFLLAGFYALFKLKNNYIKSIILFLVFVSPLAASLAVPSPHTLRSLLFVIPFSFLISLGVIFIFDKLKKLKIPLALFLSLIIIYEFFIYAHFYYVHYPQINGLDWGGAYKEIALKADELGKKYDIVIIDKNLQIGTLYYIFFVGNNVPIVVNNDWKKTADLKDKKILYIRPFYGPSNDKNIIYDVKMPYNKNEIFAQFWSL